jgi:hypothetical protein
MSTAVEMAHKYRADIIALVALVVSALSYCAATEDIYSVNSFGSEATNIWPTARPMSPQEAVCILPNSTRVKPTGNTGVYDGPGARNTHLSEVTFKFDGCTQNKGYMFTRHMQRK